LNEEPTTWSTGRVTALAMDLAGAAGGPELCSLLLQGQAVPVSRLDPDAIRRYGYAFPPVEGRVTLGNFNLVPEPTTSSNGDQPAGLELQLRELAHFAAVDEPGAASVLGTAGQAIIPEGGDAMVYGDGGVGKTTLCVDLACHLAAGDDWLGLEIPHPVRVLLIENEGPRPLFRQKLRRKLAGWEEAGGSAIGDRLLVLEQPWGELDLARPDWRAAAATAIADHRIDVAIIGPVTSIGMAAPGTIPEARAFLHLVDQLRELAGRPVAIILVHHENKGGKVSGAWEGVGDTLLHVQQQGHGRVRLFFQKARWASEQHATTLQLTWAAGDAFEIDEQAEVNRAEAAWNEIEKFVREHGPTAWGAVAESIPIEDGYLAKRRDLMLEDGIIVNAGAANHYALWHRDDPARPLSTSDEEGTE
jgi:hypothetical protein